MITIAERPVTEHATFFHRDSRLPRQESDPVRKPKIVKTFDAGVAFPDREKPDELVLIHYGYGGHAENLPLVEIMYGAYFWFDMDALDRGHVSEEFCRLADRLKTAPIELIRILLMHFPWKS